MSADGFEKTNFAWQMHQLQQRFSEWLELKLSQSTPDLPNVSFPSWLIDLIKLLWPLFKAASWLILGLVVTWLVWQLWLLLRPYVQFLGFELGNSASKTTPVNDRTTADWLGFSRQCYLEGNYGEAVRCLYMAMLQRSHETGIIPHEPSRTDGEYRQLTQMLPKQESYQVLLSTHEELCFGNAEISSEIFDRCQQAYRKIDEK
ncbi:DUF4129 domain-containing protein [Argonema galeatum]|uniref:DUF4129 domain-containing protein n=1 Tax=Argonema galeatum TaxID=2942762 RepID=UPI0020133D69|nr:DUF4129 domain-containing protein [Argonema galeatum]MCL1466618.1 DUF4129 domain-containing protein [Argonema galeatum A003/A1]